MTEQELKTLIVQLYTQFLTRLNAEGQGAFDENEIAEGAEMFGTHLILNMREAGGLDELLSQSPEEIRELLNDLQPHQPRANQPLGAPLL
jgi:hypothetical protein